MGFGILFFGYFLLLNVTFYGFSDIIAALLMIYAFYKLSGINQGFRRALYASMVFSVFALPELVFAVMELFLENIGISTVISIAAMLRSFIICIMTAFMLIGMRDLCREVELHNLSLRCQRAIIVTFIIYGLDIIWQTSDFLNNFNLKAVVLIGYLIIIATLLIVAVNLLSIYGCYMHICMPDELIKKPSEQKKSRFEFVNAFRKHEAEKQQEYYEYRLNKAKTRTEKQKNKKNGNKK